MIYANTLDDILFLDQMMRENNRMQLYISIDMFVNYLDVIIHSAMDYMQTVSKVIMSDKDIKAFDGWERLPFICGEREDTNVVCVIRESESTQGLTLMGHNEYVVLKCISPKEDIKEEMRKYFNSLPMEDQCLISITDLSTIKKIFD